MTDKQLQDIRKEQQEWSEAPSYVQEEADSMNQSPGIVFMLQVIGVVAGLAILSIVASIIVQKYFL